MQQFHRQIVYKNAVPLLGCAEFDKKKKAFLSVKSVYRSLEVYKQLWLKIDCIFLGCSLYV